MKKTTASLCLLISLASAPALAERNPADPYEGYNRTVSKFNDKADKYVLSPVARGYRKVTPKPVRTGVSNFFNNLRDVGINTTFGLGGLIDVAGAGGVPSNKNTLGDTFASWGWKNSNYFVVPLFGPSTVRDTIGNAVTTVYPVKNAVFHTRAGRWGTIGLQAINTRKELLDLTDSLEGAAIDKYSYTRDLYMKVRTQQTGGTLPQSEDDNIDIDDLVDSNATSEPVAAPQTAPAEIPDTANPQTLYQTPSENP